MTTRRRCVRISHAETFGAASASRLMPRVELLRKRLLSLDPSAVVLPRVDIGPRDAGGLAGLLWQHHAPGDGSPVLLVQDPLETLPGHVESDHVALIEIAVNNTGEASARGQVLHIAVMMFSCPTGVEYIIALIGTPESVLADPSRCPNMSLTGFMDGADGEPELLLEAGTIVMAWAGDSHCPSVFRLGGVRLSAPSMVLRETALSGGGELGQPPPPPPPAGSAAKQASDCPVGAGTIGPLVLCK